jgi:predicted SprT family Zn-dependent metalloprotease
MTINERRVLDTKNKVKENKYILNPEDYVKVSTSNLLYNCAMCNTINTTSWAVARNPKWLRLCRSCIGKYNSKNNKGKYKRSKHLDDINSRMIATITTKHPLVLNPTDYVNVSTKNLKYKCRQCNNITTTTYASIQQSNFKYTCVNCRNSNTATIHKYVDFSKRKDSLKPTIEYLLDKGCINPKDYVDYSTNNLKWKCSNCNSIYTRSLKVESDKQASHLCRTCLGSVSKGELEVFNYILSILLNDTVIHSDRSTIPPYELDIYIPSKNIAIEFHGLYWHSSKYRDSNYHYDKYKLCKDKGIQLIQVYSDEWSNKKAIVLSILSSKLNAISNVIYARNTIVKEVSTKEAKEFLDKNHIQGSVKSSIRLGLYYNGTLVSLMTFVKSTKYSYELNRFCSTLFTNVVGGASKLFKYFINNFEYNSIISFSDNRISNGNLYSTLKFTYSHDVKYDYFYTDGVNRYHKFNFRLSRQKRKFTNFDASKTEYENAINNGYERIYDAGKIAWVYK